VRNRKKYSLCKKYLNQYVKVSLTNGVEYEGYIVDVNPEYFTLAVPTAEYDTNAEKERGAPLALLTLPLFFLAGLAIGRPRPPYPYPYPYPSPYPYPYPNQTYPYQTYPYGYPPYPYKR